jgi:hypothetical protein
MGPAIGHIRRGDGSLGHRERGERKAEGVGNRGWSQRGGRSENVGVAEGTSGGHKAPVVVGKGKVLLKVGKGVRSNG